MEHLQILHTKLYKPIVQDNNVFREEIIERLEQNRDKHLTTVIAPTGYGKSVAISQWLSHSKTKSCWISVDEELNDFRTFLLYFVTSVKSIFTDSLEELSIILENIELPPDNVIVNTLINELDEIGENLILVLDDYYFIKNSQIHDLIKELIKYPPAKFHLVIISRRDPALNLSTLKSYDKLNYVRMTDLSFNRNETRDLVDKISDLQISDQVLNIILEKTEGWIVGLRLVIIALKEGQNVEEILEDLRGAKHFLSEHLIAEVFQQTDDNIKKILLIVSIFERFNEELLKELINFEDNKDTPDLDTFFRDLFDQFRKSTLFIIPLDSNGIWFRYHHFFKDFLRKKLQREYSKSIIREWHKKASEYFEKNYLFEEAIKHSVKSSDFDYAAKIFENIRYALIDTDQITRLSKLLQYFPNSVIEKHPQLILTSAFLRDPSGKFNEMGNELRIAEKLLETYQIDKPALNQLKGEFHAIHSSFSFFMEGAEKSLKHSTFALEFLHPNTSYIYDYSLAYSCFALNAIGEFENAINLLKKHESEVLPSQPISLTRKLVINSLINGFHSNFPEILRLAKIYVPICIDYKLWRSLGYGSYFLSEIYYQWNELDKVEEYVNLIDAHKYDTLPYYVLNTFFVKAFMLQVQANIEGLELCLLSINSFVNNFNNELMLGHVKSFEVELALRDNDIEEADKISKEANFNVYPPIWYSFIPQLTVVKLLINMGGNKLVEGEKRLKELVEFGRSNYNSNILIQALALQSVLHKKLGNDELALKNLNESLVLAEPRGLIRTFLDLGKELEIMIKQISEKDQNNVYTNTLLKSFEKENKLKSFSYSKNHIKLTGHSIFIDDQLSAKEIKLLKLVAEGYRNKEIADKLNLSVDSIKKYLSLVYQKLGVRNRTTAILKADKMGLV